MFVLGNLIKQRLNDIELLSINTDRETPGKEERFKLKDNIGTRTNRNWL